MAQKPTVQSEPRWSKAILFFVVGSMLLTFLAAVATVIWIGLHVLDARHDVPVARHVAALHSFAARPL